MTSPCLCQMTKPFLKNKTLKFSFIHSSLNPLHGEETIKKMVFCQAVYFCHKPLSKPGHIRHRKSLTCSSSNDKSVTFLKPDLSRDVDSSVSHFSCQPDGRVHPLAGQVDLSLSRLARSGDSERSGSDLSSDLSPDSARNLARTATRTGHKTLNFLTNLASLKDFFSFRDSTTALSIVESDIRT